MSFFSQVLIELFSFPSSLLMFHDLLFELLLIISKFSEVLEHVRVILPQLHYLFILLPHHRVLLPQCSRQLLNLYLQILLCAVLIHLLLGEEGQSLFHLISLGATHI